MTKEEHKADELIESLGVEKAIKCVDEIIKWFNTHKFISINDDDDSVEFWQSVKQHILNKA